MRVATQSFVPIVLVVAFIGLAACTTPQGSGNDQDVSGTADVQGAPGHTDNQGGVLHKTGKNDPLANCVGCHGATLQGDLGPACTSCHDNADHTASRDGVRHRSGSSSTCEACHGPDNTGGIGPACTSCHGAGGDDD